jgi:hypothetical protein
MSDKRSELMVFRSNGGFKDGYMFGFITETTEIEGINGTSIKKDILGSGSVMNIYIQPSWNASPALALKVQVNPQTFELYFEVSHPDSPQPLPPIIIKGTGGKNQSSGDSSFVEAFQAIISFNRNDSPIGTVVPPNYPYTRQFLISSNFEEFSACTIYPDGNTDVSVSVPLAEGFAISFY